MGRNTCIFIRDLPIETGHCCEPHAHECTEIVLSDGASGDLMQDGQVSAYHDQSVFVYQPGAPHWVQNKAPGSHICIGLQSNLSRQMVAGMYAASPALQSRFKEFRQNQTRRTRWRQTRGELLAGLICCDLLDLAADSPAITQSKPELVRNYIDHHLRDPLPIEDLAAMVSVHPDYLRQLFREAFGESLRSYINRKRMEQAAALLRTTADKVRSIGGAVGIENEFYFSRLFKKTYGCSPAAYRLRVSPHRNPAR